MTDELKRVLENARGWIWKRLNEDWRGKHDPAQHAVIQEIDAALSAGPGEEWQLVPKEPTERMITAGSEAGTVPNAYVTYRQWAESAYRAMLSAAPPLGAAVPPKPCTCHPDDNPPVPCPQKYALNECRAAAAPSRLARQLKPPFEIYHRDVDIADQNGHVLTAESPEIAQALLAILNAGSGELWGEEEMMDCYQYGKVDAPTFLGAAGRVFSKPTVGEPEAWLYELATVRHVDGPYDNWCERLTRYKPTVPEGSIRNLRPLYATRLTPSSDPAVGERVCPKCKGSRRTHYVITYHGERDEHFEEECRVCQGTGLIPSPPAEV